jgi:hypothetical protein
MCSIKPLSIKEWEIDKIPLFNFVLSNTEITAENKRQDTGNVGVQTKREVQP